MIITGGRRRRRFATRSDANLAATHEAAGLSKWTIRDSRRPVAARPCHHGSAL